MSKVQRPNHSSVSGVAGKAVAGILSAVMLVGVAAVGCVIVPLPGVVDDAATSGTVSSHEVSTEQLELYCPNQMTLADTEAYGDAAYQATSGNLSSAARYAAFGAVYLATVSPLSIDTDEETTTLPDSDGGVAVASNDGVGSHVFNAGLSESANGTGAAGATASWATEGDLEGLSAASCVTPELSGAFVLPDTETGVTQQLVFANSSDRATAVTLRVWGSADGNPISLTTGNVVTVGAHTETVVDLAAGAPGQQGLYVTFESAETPVAAVARMIRMDGLTPKGSDYIMPAGDSAEVLTLPSLESGDEARIIVRSDTDADVTLSWLTDQGIESADAGTLDAGRVSVFSLGQVPDHAIGVRVEADVPVNAAAYVQRDGDDDQADFTVIGATSPVASSAMVLPADVQGELTLSNISGQQTEIMLQAYTSDGQRVAERDITLDVDATERVAVTDMDSDASIIVLDDADQTVAWGMRLSQQLVDNAGLAGLANLSSTALTPMQRTVIAESRRDVVR